MPKIVLVQAVDLAGLRPKARFAYLRGESVGAVGSEQPIIGVAVHCVAYRFAGRSDLVMIFTGIQAGQMDKCRVGQRIAVGPGIDQEVAEGMIV